MGFAKGVVVLNFLTNFFLLLGANRLYGCSPGWLRVAVAAGVGGIYSGACMVPEFRFMGSLFWKMMSLCIIAWIAFGFSASTVRRGGLFALLSMAMEGIALGFGNGGYLSVIAAAGVILILCLIGFRGRVNSRCYVPVELNYGGRNLRLTALQDTGNMLRDPVTGRPVLVISSKAAQELTGLTVQQLKDPVRSLPGAGIPGLRLLPYKTVGQSGGLLLAMRIHEVKVGKWKGSALVAFAPEGLDNEGTYQALTGGTI